MRPDLLELEGEGQEREELLRFCTIAPRHGSSDSGGGRGEVAHRDETWRRALSLLLSLKPGIASTE